MDKTVQNYIDNADSYKENCNSTFDLRKDPIYSKDLTIEELQSLVKDDYFSYEELKTYFDRILEEYYLNTNE